jgi:hypothetical protein
MAAMTTVLAAVTMAAMAVVTATVAAVASATRSLPAAAARAARAVSVAEVIAGRREAKAHGGEGDRAREERGDEDAAIHDIIAMPTAALLMERR